MQKRLCACGCGERVTRKVEAQHINALAPALLTSQVLERSLLSPTVSERFRAVLLGNSHICSECSISEVRANFRNSSEFFRAYSDQFRATGRNHSDMIRTYSEQIPSKFRSYPSVLIRAIPNKDQ